MVDDEPAITQALSTRLTRDGYECVLAHSAEEALHAFGRQEFDLVLTDVQMPGLSGIELLKEVKARDPETQVIVMTAHAEVNFAVQALRLNADDYILKPFDLEQLSHSVTRALEHRRLLRENRAYRQHLEQRVQEQAERIERLFVEGLIGLSSAIEARDRYTAGHVGRVMELAVAVGAELGLDPEPMHGLWLGALLHDIGKLAIPDSILNKAGPLTPEERSLMKTHPERGVEIIQDISYLRPAISGILHHQERWDGSGYPAGLQGDTISIEGRILAVVDAFDAMLSQRPYRKALSEEDAAREVQRGAGVQFDRQVVEAFLRARARGFRLEGVQRFPRLVQKAG